MQQHGSTRGDGPGKTGMLIATNDGDDGDSRRGVWISVYGDAQQQEGLLMKRESHQTESRSIGEAVSWRGPSQVIWAAPEAEPAEGSRSRSRSRRWSNPWRADVIKQNDDGRRMSGRRTLRRGFELDQELPAGRSWF